MSQYLSGANMGNVDGDSCLFCKWKKSVSGCKVYDTGRYNEKYKAVYCQHLHVGILLDETLCYHLASNGDLKDKEHLIAGYLYNNGTNAYDVGKDGNRPITVEIAREMVKSVPRMKERLNALLVSMYEGSRYEKMDESHHLKHPFYAFYAFDDNELILYARSLSEKGLLRLHGIRDGKFIYTMTTDGIQQAEELLSTNVDSKKVFIACSFKEEYLPLREAIKQCCAECGYDAKVVSDHRHTEDITDKIIGEINTSRFVVADFSEGNQGVYYETGYARGRKIDVINLCHKDKVNELHFDVRNRNMITWKDSEEIKDQLKGTIMAKFG